MTSPSQLEQNQSALDTTINDLGARIASDIGELKDNLLIQTILLVGGEEGISGTIQDYLSSDGIFDMLKDKILETAIGNALSDSQGGKELFEKIKNAKQKIMELEKIKASESFIKELADFRQEIELGVLGSMYVPDSGDDSQEFDMLQGPRGQETTNESGRQGVVSAMQSIKSDLASRPIRYGFGSKTVNGRHPDRLDCSGLVDYVFQKSGLRVPAMTSRGYFSHFPSSQLSQKEGSEVKINDRVLSNTKPGDILYRDSINPDYRWSSGPIPEITVRGKKHKIHHIAVVSEVIRPDKLKILEANGRDGVVERIIDIKNILSKTNHQSELHISHMNYDLIPKRENIS